MSPQDTTKPTILAIDDEPQIRRALQSMLTARGYRVLLAADGEEALTMAAAQPPDAVILDLTMPGMNGITVCRELRAWYAGPILILSVHGSDIDKVTALDLGADDYLTKPFSIPELLARLRALLRRAGSPEVPPVIQAGELTIDLARRLVTRAGEQITLTPTEFSILAYLALHANCVVASTQLLDKVWGEDVCEDTQSLRSHISHLRRKIEPTPGVPQYLLTEPGIGYRFVLR